MRGQTTAPYPFGIAYRPAWPVLTQARTVVLIAACMILLAPLFLVDVPPVLDYPNHLARLYLLATGLDDPVLAQMYAAQWGPIPDLAIDAVVPSLIRLLPVYIAGKVMLGGILLLTVAGVMAYSRAVFGASRWWAMGAVLVAYNVAFVLGFLNFVVSIDLALLFAAGWIMWRERRPALVIIVACIATMVLFLSHLMGVAFFLVLVASAELEHVWRLGRATGTWTRPLLIRMVTAAPLVAGPLALYSLSGFSEVVTPVQWSWWHKAWAGPGVFVNYDAAIDIGSALFVFGFIALCLVLRRAVVAPKSVVAFGTLALLYLLLPFSLMGTHYLDLRPAIMLGLLVFGGVTPVGLSPRVQGAAMAGLALVFAARMTIIATEWAGHQADIDQLRSVTESVEPGSRVFVLDIQPSDAPAYWASASGRTLSTGYSLNYHLPAILMIEHHAFWPGLFADPAQQPLVRLQPYDDLARYMWALPDYAALGDNPELFGKLACHADYLLLLQAGAEPEPSRFGAGALQLVQATDMAALYKVKPTSCPPT